MFTAKFASPLDHIGPYPFPVFDQAAEHGLTLITAPPGYLLDDSLAGLIARQDRPLIWLRLGPEDSDPATLLLSIISSVRRLRADFGVETIAAMRARPGPIFRWPPLFRSLGDELHETLDPSTVLVFENLELLAAGYETMNLLGAYILPSLPKQAPCILISNQRLPPATIPEDAQRFDAKDLRLDNLACISLAERINASLPPKQLQRVAQLSDGLPEVLVGICAACNLLGKEYMAKELGQTRSVDDLLQTITQALVTQVDAQTQQTLGLLVQLGYSHPSLIGQTMKGDLSVDAPWFQQLTEDWERFRRIWRPLLQKNLGQSHLQNVALLNHVGSRLIAQGALAQAVRLYRWAGDTNSIAQEVCRHATKLLDLGQWDTLRGWIDQLPAASLESCPALLLYRGQISAAEGDFAGSSKNFSKAAALSSTKGDFTTACQSMLADTVVASRMGRYDRALVTAMNLLSMATKHSLDSYRGWALWQIGTLWTILGKLDQAATYFEQARHWIGDAPLSELVDEVRKIVAAQREAQQLLEFHTQAVQEAQVQEGENASRLAAMLNSPAPSLTTLLEQYGWSGVPAPMSFPPNLSRPAGEEIEQSNLWQKLLNRYRSLRRASDQEMYASEDGHSPQKTSLDAEMAEQLLLLMSAMDDFLSIDTGTAGKRVAIDPLLRNTRASVLQAPIQKSDLSMPAWQSHEPAEGEKPVPPLFLTAYFLGSFRVFVNDSPVDIWPSGRGRSLCKYLLINRQRPVHREKLMDVFWPSASPDSARNSLNVAVHDLRQAFRPLTDTAIVEFVEGAYLLNPLLDVWLDIEAFEHHLQASRQFETSHQREMAIKELESAASLYQGDFLADDLYEDWTLPTRERLRLDYLDTLARLSHDYFHQGDYTASATLCQLILNRDNCREDAHRLLMYCYCRQGQQHLALRQYQICAEALQSELQIEPEPATIELANRIRRHEDV